jgi:predicted enzyme involved in methoxymalonyl-ACP biosynthesis
LKKIYDRRENPTEEDLKKQGFKIIKGKYIPTTKNKQVETFYTKIGFTISKRSDCEIEYQVKTQEYCSNNFDYIKIENINE